MSLRKTISHLWKMIWSRTYRKELKWKMRNKHNYTTGSGSSDIDRITIGNMTYGNICTRNYGVNDGHLYIGNYCSIGPNVTFHLSGNHPTNTVSTYPIEYYCFNEEAASLSKGDIIVDDDVWIGNGVNVMSGVHIGQGAVIAAGAVVTKDVPPYAIVGGVPANIIKYRFDKFMIRELLNIDYSKLSKDLILEHKEDVCAELVDMGQISWMPRRGEH